MPKKPLEERKRRVGRDEPPGRPMLLEAPASGPARAGDGPRRGEEHLGPVVPLKLDVKGAGSPVPLNIQLIVIGAAMTWAPTRSVVDWPWPDRGRRSIRTGPSREGDRLACRCRC